MAYSKIIIYIALFFFLQPLSAQSKQGGIYNLFFQVQDSLTRDGQLMEQEILDSIKQLTENKLSEILNADIRCIYKINKNGKNITTAGVLGILESMPTNTFKNTRKNYDKDFYIMVSGNIDAVGGSPIALRSGGVSRIKPLMKLTIHVYDRDKKLIWKKNCSRGDFWDLHTQVKALRKHGRLWDLFFCQDEKPDTLQPLEVLYMYTKTLEKL